ncbi:ATP-binding protein [Hymenobacter sp. 15J16-1T3B]|uniref:ATP-binding protein n=1 Tax=Hymenobacter sp. 15J16-1T3B TaxID=2886941 RepID=UPI001D1208EA|nr:ATP-binding protein [Hymenobacter sp. 15J16-1T3B]MCC3159627.1 ATP-binding protein [Hymenobacter sp. 15J16-1T3B]
MQAIIFCGIQATGKSTFYKERLFNSHIRISLDLLRTRNREQRLLALCLDTQARFAVDNTNPTAAERARYIEPAKAAGYEIVGYYFQSVPREALLRNAQRPAAEQVPAVGIFGAAGRLERPHLAEGFDALYYVRIGPEGSFVVEPWQAEPR